MKSKLHILTSFAFIFFIVFIILDKSNAEPLRDNFHKESNKKYNQEAYLGLYLSSLAAAKDGDFS